MGSRRLRAVPGALAVHTDLAARHDQADFDDKRRAFMAMCRPRFDHHIATCAAIVESLQSRCVFAYARFDGRGRRQMSKMQLATAFASCFFLLMKRLDRIEGKRYRIVIARIDCNHMWTLSRLQRLPGL
jgi:hypothetical protein